MSSAFEELKLDVITLREATQEEYAEVAAKPEKGLHFHTGRPLAQIWSTKTGSSKVYQRAASSPLPVRATSSVWANFAPERRCWT